MPRTVDEYRTLWQSVASGKGSGTEFDGELTPTSAVVVLSPRSNMAGTGYTYTDDFGNLIGFLRYLITPSEFEAPSPPAADPELDDMLPGLKMMQEHWEQMRPKVSDGERAQLRAETEAGFDALLEDYVRDGYRPEMGTRLLDIANEHFLDYELMDVFVLPGDIQRLLAEVGNPFVDWDEEDEAAAIAAAPPFDLNLPDHRARLAERLQEAG